MPQPFPRHTLAALPTPLQRLARLESILGGAKLFVKRDDLTGLAFGGNKVRKLEFLVAEARRVGATTLITAGALQSNHTRQTAAAAAQAGLHCDLVLTRSAPWDDPAYATSGNFLIDTFMQPTIHFHDRLSPHAPSGPADVKGAAFGADALQKVADIVRARGEIPFVIPVGGSNLIGSMGYVLAAHEMLDQARSESVTIDYLIHPAGSGGTTAGLAAGFHHKQTATRVLAVDILGDAAGLQDRVTPLARALDQALGSPGDSSERIEYLAGFAGAGYGHPTPEMLQATRLAATAEGLILDPIYTGKAFAALASLVAAGRFTPSDTIVMLHTGGLPGIFSRPSLYADWLPN